MQRHFGACQNVRLHLITVKKPLITFWSSHAGGSPGIKLTVALPSFVTWCSSKPFMMSTSLHSEKCLCKQWSGQGCNIHLSLHSLSPSLSCLHRGRGINLGWRLPALQNPWEVVGKIKPSSRCQGGFRWRNMKMIYDAVIVSHFNGCFPISSLIGKLIFYLLHGLHCPPWHDALTTVLYAYIHIYIIYLICQSSSITLTERELFVFC